MVVQNREKTNCGMTRSWLLR